MRLSASVEAAITVRLGASGLPRSSSPASLQGRFIPQRLPALGQASKTSRDPASARAVPRDVSEIYVSVNYDRTTRRPACLSEMYVRVTTESHAGPLHLSFGNIRECYDRTTCRPASLSEIYVSVTIEIHAGQLVFRKEPFLANCAFKCELTSFCESDVCFQEDRIFPLVVPLSVTLT